MKKKILTLFLILVAALCFGFIGCDGNNEKGHEHFYDMNFWFSDGTYHWHQCSRIDEFECDAKVIDKEKCSDSDGDGYCDICKYRIMVHVLTHIAAKEPTCTEPGNIEYYTCSHCDKWFTDDKGLHEVVAVGFFAEKNGGVYIPTHTYVGGECSVCHTPEPSEGVYYTINEGEDGQYASVDYIWGSDATKVVIAVDFLGVPVTEIKESACDSDSDIVSIVIPDSVKTIGKYAFRNCSNLSEVKIGNGVETIGANVFTDCEKLNSVIFGSSVKEIGQEAFKGTAITDIVLPASLKTVGIDAFTSTTLTKVTFEEGIEKVSSCAFRSCSALSEVVFPNSMTAIERDAFLGCGFTDLTIPGNIKEISFSAFQDCTKLQRVVLSEGVEKLAERTEDSAGFGPFINCTELNSVTFPRTIEYIGEGSFWGTKLNELDLSDCTALTFIGKEAFTNTQLEKVVLPNSVENIVDAFSGNEKLTTVTLGTGLKDYTGAFSNCTALTTVNMPDGLTVISSAFSFSKIREIKIPSSVTFIDSYAFFRCKELEEITIPDSVTQIGAEGRLFGECEKLHTLHWNASCEFASQPEYGYLPYVLGNDSETSPEMTITIGENVTKLCPYMFAAAKINSITVPDSVVEIGDHAFYRCKKLKNITLPKGLISIGKEAFADTEYCEDTKNKDESGVVYIDNYLIKATKLINDNYTIRPGTTVIADFAFEGYAKIKNLEIPYGVVTIGDSAFLGCGITGVLNIPGSVKTIGKLGFSACDMDKITFNNGLVLIGNSAFYLCNGLTTVEIPDSVERIESFAFAGCYKLEKVTLGKGLKYIDNSIFQHSDALTEIKFDGTYNHWVEIGGSKAVPSQAILICNDGKYDSNGKKRH